MYEGRTNVDPGTVFGHENLGEVIEVGPAVERIKVGGMVCVPFNVACGYCRNCERGFTGSCLTANPGKAGGAYGYAGMGPYRGGQAEYLRVPYGDFNCLRLPPDVREKEHDYVMLADIFPTGETIGAIAIDDSEGSPVEQVLELTGGQGADKMRVRWMAGARSPGSRGTMRGRARPMGQGRGPGSAKPRLPRQDEPITRAGSLARATREWTCR
jgi:alcohol dehydrogenase-like protein